MSKRKEIRERRRRQQMQQRLIIIGMMVIGAGLVATALILPTIQPVGDFVTVTPVTYSAQVEMNTVGSADAPVRVDVWEDFQCPACQNFTQQTEPLIIQNYVETGKVFYTFHHYPFIDDASATKESDQAANASMCAGEQGRFWDYHNMLFANWNGENQGAYADKRLITFADALGLNMGDFNKCFAENRYQAQIEKDFSDGLALNVHSTPSIFVNGQLVQSDAGERYIPGFTEISRAIEAALAGQ